MGNLDSHWKTSNQDSCPGKKTFPSYKLASEFNHSMKKRGSVVRAKGKHIERLQVYRCKNCHQFHIGHAIRTRKPNDFSQRRFRL